MNDRYIKMKISAPNLSAGRQPQGRILISLHFGNGIQIVMSAEADTAAESGERRRYS